MRSGVAAEPAPAASVRKVAALDCAVDVPTVYVYAAPGASPVIVAVDTKPTQFPNV